MDREIELELRKEIREINEKMTKIQVSLEGLKIKQSTAFNFGGWLIQLIVTIVVGGVGGYFSGQFGH